MNSKLFLAAMVLFSAGLIEADQQSADADPQSEPLTRVDFWNGNRSAARQVYEREVLEAVLAATEDEMGPWQIAETLDDYPGDEESRVFSGKRHDLFVTNAGNRKFRDGDMIVIAHPMTQNLLGYRIPVIREQDADAFAAIDTEAELQALRHGIPETWSDAEIFRRNAYTVVEEGSFDDIFQRLEDGRIDYSAFGANEVLGVFENRASKQAGLVIDEHLLMFYPFPLVFYVNPDLPALASRIEKGMLDIVASGRLDEIFNRHYGDIVDRLGLEQRSLFILENPLVPENFSGLKPDLDNERAILPESFSAAP